MGRLYLLVLILVVDVVVFLRQTSAAPTPASSEDLFHCQVDGNPLAQSFITQTTRITVTEAGPITETCNITFTPATGPYGEPIVQVVKACTTTAAVPPPPLNDLRSVTSLPPLPSMSTPPPQTFRFPSQASSLTPDSSTPPRATSVTLSRLAPRSTGPTLSCDTTQSSSPVKNGSGTRDAVLNTIPTLDASPTVPGSVLLIRIGIYAAIVAIPLILLFVFGLVM